MFDIISLDAEDARADRWRESGRRQRVLHRK